MVPEDQSVPLVLLVLLFPLVLLVLLVLLFLQVLSTTSVAIADMHLRVFISHDLDLQLLRLQTHEDEAACSCARPLTFHFPVLQLWIGPSVLRSTPLTFSPSYIHTTFFPHPFIYPLPIRTPFIFSPSIVRPPGTNKNGCQCSCSNDQAVIFSG